jgi:hypothetical protein
MHSPPTAVSKTHKRRIHNSDFTHTHSFYVHTNIFPCVLVSLSLLQEEQRGVFKRFFYKNLKPIAIVAGIFWVASGVTLVAMRMNGWTMAGKPKATISSSTSSNTNATNKPEF